MRLKLKTNNGKPYETFCLKIPGIETESGLLYFRKIDKTVLYILHDKMEETLTY